ncbi:MAG: hypothetical protein IJ064_06340 [Bacteroidaceae bacterium]|nr:hypothetical protein [Bacteroidaceae bacterium]
MKRLNILLAAGILQLSAFCPLQAQNCEIHLMVAPVEQGEEVTDGFNEALMTRLEQAVSQTGIVADPNFSQFFITGKLTHFYKETLPGPPVQTALHSTLTLYVGDAVNQQIYATQAFEVRGVGNSPERAMLNAMQSLNGKNQKVQALIEKGKQKILDYYDKNYPTLISKAERAAAQNEYGEALYHLASIPECCRGYAEAYSMTVRLFTESLAREGRQLLQMAQAVYYADPSPAGAERAMQYLALIDPASPVQGDAAKLAQEIRKNSKSDYDFEYREKYKDGVALERARVDAARAIGVAWGNGQKPTTTNLMFVR